MRAGLKRHPNSPEYLIGLAQIAQHKNDHEEAIPLFEQLRKRFPGVLQGYAGAAESLRCVNRLDEAEAMAQQAMQQFPDEMGPFVEYARIAATREDWEEAIRRWVPVREQFRYVAGWVGPAQALTHLGRYDEAEEILESARYRFGVDPSPLSQYARVAEARGDIPEAIKRWKYVINFFPLEMHVQLGSASELERLGDPVGAEATLRAAIERFPGEIRPTLDLANLLHYKRRNYGAAADAWAALRLAFPDREDAYTTGAQALRNVDRPDEADALEEEYRRRFKQS
jgi:tetratricopeptide (TPR) repeat protein